MADETIASKGLTGIVDLILHQLKERGLVITLMFCAIVYFGYNDYRKNESVLKENSSLKEENKNCYALFYGELTKKMDLSLSNQKEIFWFITNPKNSKYGNEKD